MKFSYNLLKKYVDIKESPEELAEILSLKTAEVERVDKVSGDSTMEIKILYSRGDLLSHYGMAREIAALTGGGLKGLDLSYKETNEKTAGLIKVEVENQELCPRYTAQVIKNIKIGDSPEWLKDILANLGLNSINNIVDVVNYVMIEMGQPLHAFDYEKIAGHKIIVRNARKGEKITTLDEARMAYELGPETLIIADEEGPLAIAGIKGGAGSEITGSTRTIVLESANFDRTNIRKTSTKLGLRTDASIRFSYGLDPNLAGYAIYRATKLIQDLAGGEITRGNVTVYPREVKPWKISVKKSHVNSLIGAIIPEKEINKILSRICQPVKSDANKFIATVPTYRPDLQTSEDIIEEIARIYGYENIKPIPPMMGIYRPAEERSSEDWDVEQTIKARNLMKDILKGLGLTECYNYSFLGEKTKEIFDISNAPEIANPVSQEARYLRTGLIPNLALAAERNLRFYNSVRLFETGNVFAQKGDEVEEKEIIAGVIVGKNAFIELKGIAESFFRQLGIDDAEFSDVISPNHSTKYWYHPGRVAEVQIGESGIGLIGDLHPHVKSGLGIKPDLEVAQFSLLLVPLVKAIEEELEFEPIPKYPSIIRDVSILVDKDVKISQILNIVEEAGSEIVQDVDVFDIYETSETQDEFRGSEEADETERGISPGRKSIAFRVVYRADDRTLTDDEVDKVEKNIKKALEEGLGAEIR